MNRPWSTKKVTDQPLTASTVVESEHGTLRRPVDPALPPRLSAQDSRDAVNKAVTELHANGALDAGNADALDGWIDTLRPQWHAHATMASTGHEAVTQQVLGDAEATAAAARQRATDARADVRHTERLIGAFEGALLPDNGAEATERRQRRPELDRLDGLTEGSWPKVLRFSLMLLVGAGDLATFYLTLAVLFGEAESWLVWALVGSFTTASIALMHAAGHTAKNIREGQGGLNKAAVAALVVAWAALGGVAFYVRLNSSEPAASTAEVAFGVDPATASSGPSPLLTAVLLAGLFLASGVLAFWIGFSHHPRMTSYRSLRSQLAVQRTVAIEAEQAAIAAEHLLTNARAEQQRAAQRAADAVQSVDAEIVELKELARLHLAGLIGEPAATNAVTTGRGTGPTMPEPHPAPLATVLPREAADAVHHGGRVNGSPQPTAAR
ncbi:hypothetical protein [Modestobacter altitudinis]|uniref:hypothetical protein n=1 Tax=Modestobacter altitudinis TaxID=2213158 RepID=UPI00110CAF82|nr:hypothetical protein [Modestobacter altitudinis]